MTEYKSFDDYVKNTFNIEPRELTHISPEEQKKKTVAITVDELINIWNELTELKLKAGRPKWHKVTVEGTINRTRTLISPDELKNIFELGEVSDLSFYLKEADGTIIRDGCYESYSLDDTEHLKCTDLNHGLLEWSEEDHVYYRKVHFYFWKVELLGIERVSYC